MTKNGSSWSAEAILNWALASAFAGVFLSFAILRPFTKGAVHACAVHVSRGKLISHSVLLIAQQSNAFQAYEELTSYLPERERIPWSRVQECLEKSVA